MRFLLGGPEGSSADPTDDDVATAYPWPEGRRWIRAMMVTTLDGAAAGPDRLSGSISGDADKQVFHAVRRFADAVLVGAGTLRAERYGPVRAQPDDAERRAAEGLAPAPRLVVFSGSLDLPWEEPVWRESAQRPLVLTSGSHDDDVLEQARAHADVVEMPDGSAESIVAALDDAGLRRIDCEGGPGLLRRLVEAGLLDEADITVSPVFAGTEHSPRTDALPSVAHLRLEHVLEGEGFLMLRYLA